MKTLVIWQDSEGPSKLYLVHDKLIEPYMGLNGKILNRDEMSHTEGDTCEHLALMLGEESAYEAIPALNQFLRDRIEFHDKQDTSLDLKCAKVETGTAVEAPWINTKLEGTYSIRVYGPISHILVTGWYC